MDTNRKIVQALLLKDYASLKESVFSLLYAKASLALDEARVAVANAVFNEASEIKPSPERAARVKREIGKPLMYAGKKAGTTGIRTAEGKLKEATEQIEEDIQTPERAAQMKAKIRRGRKKASELEAKATRHTSPVFSVANYPSPLAYQPLHAIQASKVRALERKDAKEKASKKLYGKGGKVVKEATEQLDEVSPPDMEKMTGSKKTKASFTKQYGKRGKSVMYATAWKLHNKKAGKD
jgi:exonuclease VII small subunit